MKLPRLKGGNNTYIKSLNLYVVKADIKGNILVRGAAWLMNVGNSVNRSSSMPNTQIQTQQNLVGRKSVNQVTGTSEKAVVLHDEEVISAERIEAVVTKMNGFIDSTRTNLKFMYHEQLNEYYVAVVDDITNEVIKEIPPKKLLDMFAEMSVFMGILIDKKI